MKKYNVTITSAEDQRSYTLYEASKEDAQGMMRQYGNDPEYILEIREHVPESDNPVTWIH